MGGPRRPQGDDLLRRMEAWGDAWRAAAGCTEPADRRRAEAALRAMYAAAGRPEPAFAWVPSPAAGILAYTFASLGRRGIGSAHARGDVGTGENREFNALAAPFGMEPAWTARLAAQVWARVPPERRPVPPQRSASRWASRVVVVDPAAAAAEALGLGGIARALPLVRGAAEAGSHRGLSSGSSGASGASGAARDSNASGAAPAPALVDMAAAVLGESWPGLVRALGRDLADELFVEATRQVAAQVLVDPARRRRAVQAMQPGQWDAMTPVLAAARDVFGGFLWRHRRGRAEREAEIDARLELARSAGPWWALDGLAIVSERPLVLHRDDRGRPHRSDGPAIAWPDGLAVHAWHGVGIERWIVEEPERITVERIDTERNTEVRRVLVERFGEERLVREGGAELVHEDATGRLWRREVGPAYMWRGRSDEAVVMVEVVNSTPEPDGSRKTYFLRVPPQMSTAREAVAWTFGLDAMDYRPAAES